MDKILVVEDEAITSDLLRRYFEIVGYEVINAQTGGDALKLAVKEKPRVIILDIILPDMDGYDVCRKLRANDKTKHIPIIFLTQKDDRRDRLEGLELGADDYLTKPFDVEELRLRVHNIIGRSGGTPLVDPRTSLPNMDLIRDRLPKLLDDPNSIFIDIEIQHFKPFSDQYGPVAANQVIRSGAKIIGDLLHEIDPTHTFIGHPSDDHFMLVVPKNSVERVEKELPERFSKHAIKFYDIPEQDRGHMKTKEGKKVPFMVFSLARVTAERLKELMEQAHTRQVPTVPVNVTEKPEPNSEGVADAKDAIGKSAAKKSGSAQLDTPTHMETTPAKKEDKPALKALAPASPGSTTSKPAKDKPHPAKPDLKIVVDNTQKDPAPGDNGKSGKDVEDTPEG